MYYQWLLFLKVVSEAGDDRPRQYSDIGIYTFQTPLFYQNQII